MNPPCIFCSVVSSEVSSHKVYQDELVVAFFDVHPVSRGHILIIPNEHYESIFDTPEPVLERINAVAKHLAVRCKDILGATGVNILNASGKDAEQSVYHLHYHLVPRYPADSLHLWFHKAASMKNENDDLYTLFVKQ